MNNEKKLMIIGAGGHGKVIADIALNCGFQKIAFLDDGDKKECMGFPIIGKTSDAKKYKDCFFIIAIGNAVVRERIQNELLNSGLEIATLIHPASTIASNVSVGKGTVIMAGAVVNPCAKIADGCIINTGATVDHDNVIESFAHVSVGSHLAGTVKIGKGTWIGAGAVVSNNITVCAGCMIGAGAVVVKDIEVPGTYIGVPAKLKE
ncbi:MAG: acetyltransferase [Acutalibacteraceae bacterium]